MRLENNFGCNTENDGLVGDSSLLVLETSRIKSRDDGIQDQDYLMELERNRRKSIFRK